MAHQNRVIGAPRADEVLIFAFTRNLSLDFVTKNTGFKPAYDDSALWLIDILLQCSKMNVCLLIEG